MAAAKPANQKLQRTEPAYVPALAMILSFKIPKGYRGKVRILPDRHEVAKSRKVFVAAIVLSAPKANPHPDRESSESLSNREFRVWHGGSRSQWPNTLSIRDPADSFRSQATHGRTSMHR